VHTVQQDGDDLNTSGRRAGKAVRGRKGREPRSNQDRDRFLLTVSTLARLDRMSVTEFELFCEHAVPPDEH
jgi:hypothetical protein